MQERTETSTQALVPALNVEVVLYVTLTAAAFALRVLALGAAPLAAAEAQQALASWDFVHGTPSAFTGSPLLFAGNAVVFALFGGTDFGARLIPALFGTALVLAPAMLRDVLGRRGALVASALLVFSPSLILFSRQLDGAIIATTCALGALAFGWRYWVDGDHRESYAAAACLALALLASRDVWTIMAAFALLALLVRLRGEARPRESRSLAGAGLVLLLVFVGVGTVFLLHRDGVGAAFSLFGAWFEGLRPGGAPSDPLRLLALYDPLALFFGVIALIEIVFLIRESKALAMPLAGLATWTVVAFILYSIGEDKSPARDVVIVVPLALIAGWYIGDLWTRLVDALAAAPGARQVLVTQEAPIYVLACALAAYLYLVFAEFALRGGVGIADVLAGNLGMGPEAAAGFDVAIMGGLVVVSIAAIAFLGLTMLGSERTGYLAVALVITLLSAWTFRQSILLNYTLAPDVRDWLVPAAGAANRRDLVADIEDASRWRANDSHTIDIVVADSLRAKLGWDLRNFRNAAYAGRPAVGKDTQAVLLAPDAPAPAANWISQRYQIEQQSVAGARPGLLRWLLFRDVGTVETVDVVLWLPPPQ
ncbi:MAG: glycosyltransferase family 39 protein [Chloroflexi bacterium]|nr:glycosyltransferase family 39 protein [Chloroflexota bacterium]